ncbi:hypothetical protein EU971_09940 [Yersinia pseudotuberculosis]|nr:hypothetical protein EU971_09940 [Yersinia pseudotuberculosis]
MGSKQEVLNHYLTRYMTRLNGGFCILSGNLLILLVPYRIRIHQVLICFIWIKSCSIKFVPTFIPTDKFVRKYSLLSLG